MKYRDWLLACALFAAVGGCGGTDATPDPGASGASAAGASGAGGSSGAAGGGAAGSSSGGDATAGSGPVGSASCSGAYGVAVPVMVEDAMATINGISLTADELEVYYARGSTDGTTTSQVVRRTRAAKNQVFGPAETLTELAGVCGELPYVNPDISEDGLSLYVTCTAKVDFGMSEGVSPLRVARRAARSAAFTLDAQPIGGVFASAGISADELTAYTDGEIFETAPQMFTRATKTETFTGPQPVPGITTALRSLDISSDGLVLFGAASTGDATAIHRAVRASTSAAFGAPQPLELQLMDAGMNPGLGAPNVTASCTLYLVVAMRSAGYAMFAASPR